VRHAPRRAAPRAPWQCTTSRLPALAPLVYFSGRGIRSTPWQEEGTRAVWARPRVRPPFSIVRPATALRGTPAPAAGSPSSSASTSP
jgi:hypothetical protein